MKSGNNLGEIVKTADGSLTLRNPDIDEEYHSTAGAAFESQELYIDRSGILDVIASKSHISILDVGLGLGYNALVSIENWLKADVSCNVDIVSLEINPSLVECLSKGTGVWQEGWSQSWIELGQCLSKVGENLWKGEVRSPGGAKLSWTVLVGDSSKMNLPDHRFDYIWQDAFSPKKNPELWSPEWFSKVAKVSSPDVVLMTYSVARVVKDGLEQGGWDYERIAAPGKKRHWLKAKISAT